VITLVHTLLNHEATKVKSVLIVCPLTTVLNWKSEFDKWLQDLPDFDDINIYELTKYVIVSCFERRYLIGSTPILLFLFFRFKNNTVRADHLRHWARNGGVMILGYEMFRSLVNCKKLKEKARKQITGALLDPGKLLFFK
jgi:transcriptional regulator ATRX